MLNRQSRSTLSQLRAKIGAMLYVHGSGHRAHARKQQKRTGYGRCSLTGVEPLESRRLLAADTVIELKLDVTQGGQSILDAQRQFVVEKGQKFDLELRYDDKRPHLFNSNHLGAFTVYADILADNAHAFRPVLSETQIITISEDLRDATGGQLVLSANGRTATIPLIEGTIAAPSLSQNASSALKQAIEGANGLNFGVGSVSVFESLREPRDDQGTLGTGDPFEYIVRFVGDEYEFADIPKIEIDTSGIAMLATANPPTGEVQEINVYSDPATETLNSAAFYYNLDARSASLNNKIVYGNVQSGSFNLSGPNGSEVFDEVGGTGPLESSGMRAVAASVFGADTPEYNDFLTPISNVEVFSIELQAIEPSQNVNFTLDRADSPDSEMSAYGIDNALLPNQVLIDLVDDPAIAGDDRSGMVFGTIVDTPGIKVTPVTGLQTSESGNASVFTIELDTLPLSDVTIDLSSSIPTEGTVSPSRVTFTPSNGTIPQVITVTGVDDDDDDGNVAYTIITSTVTTEDPFYHGLDPADVSLLNIDDDIAGITVSKTSGLSTSESGAADSFSVVLDTRPTHEVTIAIESSNLSEASVSPAMVTFNRDNWSTAQTVNVVGVNDFVDDDNQPFTIVTKPAVSQDALYSQINASDVTGFNVDNDTAGITISGTGNLAVDEAGELVATFFVALNTVPLSPVTLGLSVSDSTEGQLSQSSIVFTPANGTTPVAVEVTGVNDQIDDGDVVFSIITAPLVGDSKYQQINPIDVQVTNRDDDTAGITVTKPSNPTTNESGTSFQFSIVLDTVPTHNVTIPVSSSRTSEATVDKSFIIFSPANALTAQTVTVTGVDDSVDDGDVLYDIRFGTVSTSDSKYRVSVAGIAATNIDNDSPVPPVDFGDAPAPYPTRLTNNGPRHSGSGLFLGSAPTLENDGQPTATANGDGSDDGVTFLTSLVAANSSSSTSSLRVNASGVGKLDAWIDFNRDGDWADAGEKIANSISLVGGNNFVGFTVPSGASPGATFARFRVSSAGGLTSVGVAADGEVEDYAVELVSGNAGADVSVATETGETTVLVNNATLRVTQFGHLLFSANSSTLENLQVVGTDGDDTVSLGDLQSAGFAIQVIGGDGEDTLRFIEAGNNVDLLTTDNTYSNIETISIEGSGPNSIKLDAATVAAMTSSTDTLTVQINKSDTSTFVGQWVVSGVETTNGKFFQRLTLDGSTIRFNGGSDWTNPLDPLDVNNSGKVTAIDALQILNQMRRRDFLVGASTLVDASSLGAAFPSKFYDTNRDGELTPIDALRVINLIANATAAQSEFVPPIGLAQHRSNDAIDDRDVFDLQAPLEQHAVDTVFGLPETWTKIRSHYESIDEPNRFGNDQREATANELAIPLIDTTVGLKSVRTS